MFSGILEPFVEARPVSVMVRSLMERIFEPQALDALFERHATRQQTKELLFSTVVGLMRLVVSGIHPRVGAAYQALEKVVGVSRPALQGKLNGMEPTISQALVRYSVEPLMPVMAQLQPPAPPLRPGDTIRISDGKHVGATEHRLAVLRDQGAGARPGQSIAGLEPQQLLVGEGFPCEDGHAQERSLVGEGLQTVNPQAVWIADRNFCTRGFFCGIAQRHASFGIRAHQN